MFNKTVVVTFFLFAEKTKNGATFERRGTKKIKEVLLKREKSNQIDFSSDVVKIWNTSLTKENKIISGSKL